MQNSIPGETGFSADRGPRVLNYAYATAANSRRGGDLSERNATRKVSRRVCEYSGTYFSMRCINFAGRRASSRGSSNDVIFRRSLDIFADGLP